MDHRRDCYRLSFDPVDYPVTINKLLSDVCVVKFGHNSTSERKRFE